MGMVDRVFLFSHPRFYLENLKFVVEVLLKNDYPLKFIFNAINSRLKFFLSNRFHRKTNNNKDKNCWFTISFTQSVSNKFKHVVKDLNTRLSFFSINKLDYIIKAQKDILPIKSKKKCGLQIDMQGLRCLLYRTDL